MVSPASGLLPRGLPSPRTRLIGRETECASARALLLDEAVPLLTLVGPGGVGKTRLALAVAQDVADHFADGIAWVDLSPLTDPSLVPATVAAALDHFLASDQPVAAVLARHLRSLQTLLIFDNCEHLASAVADLVAALLPACPSVQVLATSRAALRLRDEQEFPVTPLPLPAPGNHTLEAAAESPAVRLFVERARAIEPGFVLAAGNAQAVAEICHGLDGLPLAIELAAAQTKVLPPAALLARMGSRLSLLTSGARDLPVRQQTVRATIAWSHDLLTDAQRVLFRRLGVFVGGWTLDAAETVAGDGDGPDGILTTLTRLVDANLVRRVDPDGAHAPRFGMLETVRVFALEQLEASGEADGIRDRHATWCVAEAEAGGVLSLWDYRPGEWFRRITLERSNIRAALDWLEVQGQARLALRLATAATKVFWLGGPIWEGRDRLARALALAGEQVPEVRARALSALADLLWEEQGDLPAAEAAAAEALALFQAVGNVEGRVHALIILAGVAADQGDLDRGQALLEEAVAMSPPDGPSRAEALEILAAVTYLQGDDARTVALLEERVRLAHSLDDPAIMVFAIEVSSWVAERQGDVPTAAARLQQALGFQWKLHARPQVAHALEHVAALAAMTGQGEVAVQMLGTAAALRETLGRPLDVPLRPAYDRLVATLRTQVDDASWTRAWDAGWEDDLATAVAEADGLLAALAAGTSSLPAAAPHALSPREQAVLRLVVDGRSNQEIADALGISLRTAQTHVAHILTKLGVDSRTAAATRAVREGWV
jgi:non-specific serine/threonine protein kinase